ncbi:hypothetical protein FOL47_000035 [Perkinsus chesapeaki]|uniref:Exostosin GT47 domain-containing protein n=1 Tax=Perkinsus chesapeaki TaxID=330153 RepID=A0A7J6N3K0_PERCH|nr:hypothetical protein FOL47_000035 [Perkinsus chesapeaki]
MLNLACLLIPLLSQIVSAFDGQSDPASEEMVARIWDDPDCLRDRALDWALLHDALRNTSNQRLKIDGIIEHYGRGLSWDDILEDCLFGGVALLYWRTRQLLESGHFDDEAVLHFSLLDSYTSSFHPAIMARGNWGINDSDIAHVRRSLADRNTPDGPHRLPCGKVYVYTEDDAPSLRQLTQGASFCGKGQWGSEVHIHYWFLAAPHRTLDPAEADYFFVPGYGICMFEGGFLQLSKINDIYRTLTEELPFWQPGGRRHVFTFASGMGVDVFREWEVYIPNATILTPETGLFNDNWWRRKPSFVPWRDVAIPGHLHRSEILHFLQASMPLDDRWYLAVFFGRVDPSRAQHLSSKEGLHDAPRQALFEMLRQTEPIKDVLFGSNLTVDEMRTVMGNAKFCLVPRGKSAWSLRLYEALWAGCVPVILSDRWSLPFPQYLPEQHYALRFPMRMAASPFLIDELRAVTKEKVQRLLAGGRKARCLFSYGVSHHWGPLSFLQERHVHLDGDVCPPDYKDAFDGICMSLENMFSPDR